jgi:hypothetical protein
MALQLTYRKRALAPATAEIASIPGEMVAGR